MKKILVVGNGGREHAICEALYRSAQNIQVVNVGGYENPGISALGSIIEIADINDPKIITEIGKKHYVAFAVVGPENPIAAGVTDELRKNGIPCFAPSKKCGQLESSKSFTRNLLKKHNIDASPAFEVFEEINEGLKEFFDQFEGQIVVKADGLIGGKGVLVAGDHFSTYEEVEEFSAQSIEKFGRVVLEEKLIGEEFSLISLVDGKTVLDCPAIQDHKRAFEGDTGPNTGGMGCISNEHGSLPFLNEQNLKDAHHITEQVMSAIEAELGERFIGVMYGGFMVTKRGVKLIEYNARFGDPEALNILPILETDFVEVCEKAIAGKLSSIGKLKFKNQSTVVKYLCPEGYPNASVKNVPVTCDFYDGENFSRSGAYFASVAKENDQLILKGSRGIGILGTGNSIDQANKNCDELITHFSGPVFYRKDIGTPELIQKRVSHMKEVLGN